MMEMFSVKEKFLIWITFLVDVESLAKACVHKLVVANVEINFSHKSILSSVVGSSISSHLRKPSEYFSIPRFGSCGGEPRSSGQVLRR